MIVGKLRPSHVSVFLISGVDTNPYAFVAAEKIVLISLIRCFI
jgi:hypothetical protein